MRKSEKDEIQQNKYQVGPKVEKALWKYTEELCLAVICVENSSEQLPKVFIADQCYEVVIKNASGILGYFNNVKCLRRVEL